MFDLVKVFEEVKENHAYLVWDQATPILQKFCLKLKEIYNLDIIFIIINRGRVILVEESLNSWCFPTHNDGNTSNLQTDYNNKILSMYECKDIPFKKPYYIIEDYLKHINIYITSLENSKKQHEWDKLNLKETKELASKKWVVVNETPEIQKQMMDYFEFVREYYKTRDSFQQSIKPFVTEENQSKLANIKKQLRQVLKDLKTFDPYSKEYNKECEDI
jgi:hypothetical protein